MKQRLAFNEVVVKGSSLTKAMIKVGYSPSTAKRTNKLTRTDGWQELLDKYIPEKSLMKVQKQGLKAGRRFHKIIGRDENGKPLYKVEIVADYSTRHKYLETGLKLRGKLRNDEPEGNTYNIVVLDESQRARTLRRIVTDNGTREERPDNISDGNESEI